MFSEGYYGCKCNATYCDTVDPVTRLPEGNFILYSSSENGLHFSKTYGKFQMNNYDTSGTKNYIQ